MAGNLLIDLIIFLLVSKVALELWLGLLNRREALVNSKRIPEAFVGFIDQATYDKSIQYTLAKNSFEVFEIIYGAVILAFFLLSGILPWMFYHLEGIFGTSLWGQSLTVIGIGVVLTVFYLPTDWYSKFVLEEKFGFNRSSVGLWIGDKIKEFCLFLVIGVPVFWVVLKCFERFPRTWWVWAFLFFVVFQLLMLVLYPKLILPLFNKLKPLEEGSLKDRLMHLADRTGFKASTIEVMDGSKRSGHSNAFFTGFGKFRRIVLYDTLIEQLEPKELEAVLAHEIGHYKKGHVLKMLGVSTGYLLAIFVIAAWLVQEPWFYESFGFSITSGVAPALLVFVLLSGIVGFWLTPLVNLMSRKNEYEADFFAKEAMGEADSLISSLRKMSEKNLSNLTPNHFYSAFHYSHPTLLEREAALRGSCRVTR